MSNNISEFRSLATPADAEVVIKKSRFITHVAPVADEAEALAVIEAAQRRWPDARHHCYAYIAGFPQMVVRMSDDGEPAGTAGKPILEVMQREGLLNAVVVVSRIFGGVLLGAAGLVRAYAAAAKAGIDASGVVTYVKHRRWLLRCDYSGYQRLAHRWESEGIAFEPASFGEDVELKVAVAEEEAEDLVREANEILSGRAEWKPLDDAYLPARSGQL